MSYDVNNTTWEIQPFTYFSFPFHSIHRMHLFANEAEEIYKTESINPSQERQNVEYLSDNEVPGISTHLLSYFLYFITSWLSL